MKSNQFPYIATPLGLLLLVVVMYGGRTDADGATTLPLLTLLLASEFAFFVTAIAAWLGVQHIRASGFRVMYAALTGMCAILAVRFAILGFSFWPNL